MLYISWIFYMYIYVLFETPPQTNGKHTKKIGGRTPFFPWYLEGLDMYIICALYIYIIYLFIYIITFDLE